MLVGCSSIDPKIHRFEFIIQLCNHGINFDESNFSIGRIAGEIIDRGYCRIGFSVLLGIPTGGQITIKYRFGRHRLTGHALIQEKTY